MFGFFLVLLFSIRKQHCRHYSHKFSKIIVTISVFVTKLKMKNKVHNAIILNQCVGILFVYIFENNVLLNYFTNLGLTAALVLFLLSLPDIFNFLFIIPSAYLSDKIGIKKFGLYGLILMAISAAILVLSNFLTHQLIAIVAIFAISLYSLGRTIYTGSWNALINPHIEPATRGRFLAKLKLFLGLIGIAFTFFTGKALSLFPDHNIYLYIFIFISISFIHRFYTYKAIPEIESEKPKDEGITHAIKECIMTPNYLSFCCYAFLINLFTGTCPWLFSLQQKTVLHFQQDTVVLLINLMFIGNMIGFYIGGQIIDKVGTKPVFFICHLAFGGILTMIVLRMSLPFSIEYTYGGLMLIYGIIAGKSSVAISSEILTTASEKHKALSISILFMMFSAGKAISAIIAGQILHLNILQSEWKLGSFTLNQFDSLLAGSAIMIILLVVTLGLVPSIIGPKKNTI